MTNGHCVTPQQRTWRRPAAVVLLTALTTACAVQPVPLTTTEQASRANESHRLLFADTEAVTASISLGEAISRALRFNYEHRAALMEETIQRGQLDLATFNMLPRLAASAGYNFRDDVLASSSRSILSGRQSLEPSTSTESERTFGDLTFTWNILDFGVSYFQAKQQADRALIAVERRRRVVNNMIKEVRSAYWRAASAQVLLPQIDPILAEAERALEASRIIERKQLLSAIETLEYRKSLLQTVGQLRALRAELAAAKAQLATLIHLPPGQAFSVEVPGTPELPLNLAADLETLEHIGLTYRPEIREEVYQGRISRDAVRKEFARMFPGVSLVASTNYDSNDFLVHNNWAEAGVRVTWNLLGLLSAPTAMAVAERQTELAELRSKALGVSVLTQIHVAWHQYRQALEAYDNAQQIAAIDAQLLTATQQAADLQAQTELERVRRSVAALAGRLERDRSLVQVQGSLADLYIAMGIDLIDPTVSTHDPAATLEAVNDALGMLARGELPHHVNVAR